MKGKDKIVPVIAVNKVVMLSDVFRNFVEIVKKAKHKAAKNGKIMA